MLIKEYEAQILKSQNVVFRPFGSSPRMTFARTFFKFPTMLGSAVPSSRFLVNDLLSKVQWDRARVIVEYGPGVGTITQEILRRMRSDAVLVAIKLNNEFVTFLRSEIHDPRLRTVHASALDVRDVLLKHVGPIRADYIVSGIPYSTIPEAIRWQILKESRQLLQPQGAFLVYQFTKTVLPYLKASFSSVKQTFQLFNIMPARIFYCTE
jgi:phospholipid N-methyltransferase